MTICKMRDMPFDVLSKNRFANMTSVDGATRLANEWQVKRKEGWPSPDKDPPEEEKLLT